MNIERRTPFFICLMLASSMLFLCATLARAQSHPGNTWVKYSYNYANWNFNPYENDINRNSARYLRRAWETFNDDQWRPGAPPSGFVLEGALGLEFPSTVVGVVSPPIIVRGTIYYIDELGTVFARDARTGTITDPQKHWTTTLVDNDYVGNPPIAPELYYTAPAITDTHLWFHSSLNGRVHALDLETGQEMDFDNLLTGVQAYPLLADLPLASSLGEAVVVALDANNQFIGNVFKGTPNARIERVIYITEVNVILNDALIQGQQVGTLVALDISDPANPYELWRRPTIDNDPATGQAFGSGVSAGSGLAVDLGRGWIFGGTGQNTRSPYSGYPDAALAPSGFIDRSDSIYAVDIRTGEFVWTNQLHSGDVFDLNNPVPTGPNQPGGVRDADVLSPPILYNARVNRVRTDIVACGSKGGLFRAVNRDTGATIWERQISKATGIGGIQAGAAYANNTVYVAGFEGLDDDFSDANFNAPGSTYANAFFGTFAPAFWADVEDTRDDGIADTGMRIKLYALNAANGRSRWRFSGDRDFVELKVGAALRHVSVTTSLIYVTTTSGQLFVIDRARGTVLFEDQTVDLNELFGLGLGKPHHAGMNAGALVANGMVYTPYGGQNNPSGGIIAYEVNEKPTPGFDLYTVWRNQKERINILANDTDPNGDALRITAIRGRAVRQDDGQPDRIAFRDAIVTVYNRGDNPARPDSAYVEVEATPRAASTINIRYSVEDLAPNRIVNGGEVAEPEPSHTSRSASGLMFLQVR